MSTKLPTTGQQITDGKNWGQIINSILTNVTTAREGAGSVTGIPGLYSAITTYNSLTEAALKLNGGGGAIIMDNNGHKRISWNDGAGNFNLRGGNVTKPVLTNGTITSHTTNYAKGTADANGGAALVSLSSDGIDGVVILAVAPIGVPDTVVTWANTLTLNKTALTTPGNLVVGGTITGPTITELRNLVAAGGADNLGNHTATKVLNMNNQDIIGVKDLGIKGKIASIGGFTPANSAIRLTPNLHLNSGDGTPANVNNAVLVNWDNGTPTNKAQYSFAVANGAGAPVFGVSYNGTTGINGPLSVTGATNIAGAITGPTITDLYNKVAAAGGASTVVGDHLGNHTATMPLNMNGQVINGVSTVNVVNNTGINGTGRLLITGEENLYLLNKGGVIVGKEAGGTGNLSVQGDIASGYVTSVPLKSPAGTWKMLASNENGTIINTQVDLTVTSGPGNYRHLGAWAQLDGGILVYRAFVADSIGSLSQANIDQVKAQIPAASGADNLGNHTATTTLNMNGNSIHGIGANTTASPGSASGLAISWNRSGGQGEVNFFNQYGAAAGPAYVFHQVKADGSAQDLVTIDVNGGITTQGSTYTGGFTQIGGGTSGSKLTVLHAGPASVAAANWTNAHMELRSTAPDQSVNISFHRAGAYGANFGLDADGQFSTAGWSGNQAGFTGFKTGYVTSSPLVSAGNQLVGANVNGTIVPTGMIFGGLNPAAAHWNGTYAWKHLGSWVDASDGQAILVHRAAVADLANTLSQTAINQVLGQVPTYVAPDLSGINNRLGAVEGVATDARNRAVNLDSNFVPFAQQQFSNFNTFLGQANGMWNFADYGGNGGTASTRLAVYAARAITAGGGIRANGDMSCGGNFQAGGNISTGGSFYGNLVNGSDIVLKENVETLVTGLDIISKLRGVSYNWKNKARGESKQYGVIAQELEKVMPELVSKHSFMGEEETKGVNYIGIIAPLIEAVKELKTQVDALKVEIATLKK